MTPEQATALASVLFSHITSAAIVVYGLQMLKNHPWYCRIVNDASLANKWVHRIVSMGGAAISGVGIHAATEGSMTTGWHIAIVIPPLWIVLHALWDLLNQLALQQLIFDGFVKGRVPPVVSHPAQPHISLT